MDMRKLRKRIKEDVLAHTGVWLDPHQLTRVLMKEFDAKQVRDLAYRYVLEMVEETKRAEARKVEQASINWPRPLPQPSPRSTPEPRHESYAWNKDGRAACLSCGCDKCMAALGEYERSQNELTSKLWSGIKAATDKLAAELRLEITQELLASSFALGDGRHVTWAEATVEDHEVRIKLLETNAFKNIETASKHQAAINMLREANAPTLGSLDMLVTT